MDKTFTENQQQAWVCWVRGGQLVMERVEQALKESGFPPLAWYDVLLELESADGGRLRLQELGERMLLKKFSVTRLVDRLQAEGCVTRVACDYDARGAYAAITPKGRKLRRAMWPIYYEAVHRYFFKDLGEKETRVLATALGKILRNCESK